MTDDVAASIQRGLEQAIAHARGEAKPGTYRVHISREIDVRAIRAKLGMTQEEFAIRFRFNVNTLRQWEQGRRSPDEPARAYLKVIDHAPDTVQKVLTAA